MLNHSWRFGDLLAAELLPHLQQHLNVQDATANWQLVWLNNDGHPVIGLLPKVSWSVYFNANQKASALLERSKSKTTPYKVIKTFRDKQSSIVTHMSYSDWQNELIAYSKSHHKADIFKKESLQLTSISDTKPSYQHGLIGFIGYDIAAYELSATADIPYAAQPCATLAHYDIYLSLSKEIAGKTADSETYWQLNTRLSETDDDTNRLISTISRYLQSLDNALNNELIKPLQPAPLILTAKWQKNDYQQAFRQTQQYLNQGDCYQINLTQAWQSELIKPTETATSRLLNYLPTLHANTKAPFAGYLGFNYLPNEEIETNNTKPLSFELLSCSPELFFTFIKDPNTKSHHIITKPIKGTMPRGDNLQQDLSFKQQLIASDKDRSENVMIVDLLRNDLGKYAKVGSVKVPQLFDIESFSNVHHMVSTITAELKNEVHPLTVLFGSLPAGSITGTPKKRAVEIIAELEGEARGAYCGTMGYMNFTGSGQWNVLIRTLQASCNSTNENQVSLWAGGGITVSSDCAAEYQECLDKVGNLLSVLAR